MTPAKALEADPNLGARRRKEQQLRQLMERRERQGRRATAAQQRLWFMHQWAPDSPLYNMPCAIDLTGPLNVTELERSLDALVARHEALRTVFAAGDGEPRQVVQPARPADLDIIDLSGEPDPPAAVARALTTEGSAPFDLERGPLFRPKLLIEAPGRATLLMVCHHIVSDGWSMDLLLRDFKALYEGLMRDPAFVLPPAAAQFSEHSDFESRIEASGELEAGVKAWAAELQGVPRTSPLTPDRRAPAIRAYRGRRLDFALSPDLTAAIDRLARTLGASEFMVMLAALATLAHRHYGQDDMIVGTPVANRTSPLTEAVGMFVNIAPLRLDLRERPTFRELVASARRASAEAFSRQHVPYERVLAEVSRSRGADRAPLVSVMLMFQPAADESFRIGDLEARRRDVPVDAAPFDVTLTLRRRGERLFGAWEYDVELFDHDTIRQLAGNYEQLLAQIPGALDQSLEAFNWAEPRFAPRPAPPDALQDPDQLLLHRLFEHHAAAHPHAPAVEDGSRSLTYRELDRLAETLAAELRGAGVEPEMPVGLLAERSIEAVVGMLGVLKAGGAFVPLDLGMPAERLKSISMTMGLAITIAAGDDAGVDLPGRVLRIGDDCWRITENPAAGATVRRVRPDNLAYIVHTSGSTTRPKPVMVSHRAICGRMCWEQEADPVDATDAILSVAQPNFDAWIWECFRAFLGGARLVLAPPRESNDPRILQQLIDARGVTTLAAVPSVLDLLTREGALEGTNSLRRVVSSGEELGGGLHSRFFRGPAPNLRNFYGQTEVTIDAAFWQCRSGDMSARIPVGHAIDGMELLILDQQLRPVPDGTIGQIFFAGRNLSRGYYSQPRATAEHFLPHPFATGQRMFRTGDVGRLRHDGALILIGRDDDQIKLRGVRVEPGEIESLLAEHPRIREAAVVPIAIDDAETTSDPTGLDHDGLRAWLGRLPPQNLQLLERMIDEY